MRFFPHFPKIGLAALLVFSFEARAEWVFSAGFPTYLANAFGTPGVSPVFNSLSEAGIAAEASCNANATFGGSPASCNSFSLNVSNQWTFLLSYGGGGNYSFSWVAGCPVGYTEGTDPEGQACIEDGPSCSGNVTGKAIVRPATTAQASLPICGDSSSCQFNPVNVIDIGGGQAMVEYEGSAADCDGADPQESETAGEQSNCISSGPDTFCTEPDLADQNCGMLNDAYICLDSVPSGNCTFYGNGDMACDSGAGSPPAPDDGVTPGSAAPPDGTITINGQTYNIYNNTTVSGSSGETSGTQQTDAADPQMLELDFSEIIEQEPDSGSFDDAIVQDITDTGAELDTAIGELDDPNDFGVTSTAGDEWSSIFGYTYSCTDIVLDAFGNSVTLQCAELADLRAILGWIARVIFFIAIFNLIMRRPE